MSSGAAAQPAQGGGPNIAVAVGVPIIIVIVTIAIILLLVLGYLYYRSKKQEKELDSRGAYEPVPMKEDSGSASMPSLPATPPSHRAPPTISLGDPPVLNMQFTMATKLGEKGSQRYPFMGTHKQPEGKSLRDTKHPRQRTKRKGNHKHGNGKHVVLKSGSFDTSSDISDSSSGRSEIRPRRKSPLITSPSQSEAEEPAQKPEIYFCLKFPEESTDFTINVDRVTALPTKQDGSPRDSYVRIFLVPKLASLRQRPTANTQTQKKECSPVFNEDVHYKSMSKDELINSTLQIEVLNYVPQGKHELLGQVSVNMASVNFVDGEAPMKLPLIPPEIRESLGTVNLSICYSPEAKRLSVIILRAKDLNKGRKKETDPQAKLWVTLAGDKFIGKLKTSKKGQSCAPIFNEVVNCTVEQDKLTSVAVNVAITNEHKSAGANKTLGQVTLCTQSTGEESRHWNDVMATPGKHIAEWHELR